MTRCILGRCSTNRATRTAQQSIDLTQLSCPGSSVGIQSKVHVTNLINRRTLIIHVRTCTCTCTSMFCNFLKYMYMYLMHVHVHAYTQETEMERMVCVPNKRKQTALHLAVENGHIP